MSTLFDRLQSEIETRELVEGITAADLLDLTPELRSVINMILRQGQMTLAQIVLELDMKPSEARELLNTLVDKGILKVFDVKGEQYNKTYLGGRRTREVPLNIWEALGDKVE